MGHQSGFVGYPNRPDDLEPGKQTDDRDEHGRITMVIAREKGGHQAIRYRCPTIYFCHENGFIVSCDLGWREISGLKFDNKFEEVIGLDTDPSRQKDHVLTRKFQVLSTETTSDGYLRVTLYSNLCNKTKKNFYVHHLVLITFRGRRPEGIVGHHIFGNVKDNRVVVLAWISIADNSRLENLNRNVR